MEWFLQDKILTRFIFIFHVAFQHFIVIFLLCNSDRDWNGKNEMNSCMRYFLGGLKGYFHILCLQRASVLEVLTRPTVKGLYPTLRRWDLSAAYGLKRCPFLSEEGFLSLFVLQKLRSVCCDYLCTHVSAVSVSRRLEWIWSVLDYIFVSVQY